MSPYTGLTTPAVITTSNADNIARQAFAGGDLGANVMLAPVRGGDAGTAAGNPMAVTLVRLLSGAAAAALPAPSSARAPSPRSSIDNTESDGMGGTVHYTLSVNDWTGEFTGTFEFTNFHGDGGGVINGTVAVRGVVSEYFIQFIFDFRSVTVVDGAVSVTAQGTADLTVGTGGGQAVLDLYFTDNGTGKCVWLSGYTVAVTDLGDATDIRTFGRIYLPDYGYVDVWTEAPFLYPTGGTFPTGGVITLTGSPTGGGNCRARMAVVDADTYSLEVDADGDGSYEWTVTHAW